ncbi:delta-type opioid receptor-like [Oreochromis niloticus]|uniref:delta-type opioid receptor-like n=1 Tax=Oreochromis niloticus TaxID=8128 RepID=UPI00025FC04B|nr:delta-type opioid receptor-like [Oreochromis niloticus]CAI5635912.1 unnamed protein product [Mustela putorius furo]
MNTEDHSNISSILFFLPTFHNCFFQESCLDRWYIAAGVVILLSSILGILANINVTWKLIQNLHGSSMSQHHIFNLALSDLLCLLILLVGSIVFWTGLHLNHSICQLLIYLLFFCNTTNLNVLVLISIQKYYQILRREKWIKVTPTQQKIFLSSVWLLGALLGIFFLSEVKIKGKWTDKGSCENFSFSPVQECIYIAFTVISHVVSLACYSLLVRGMNRIQISDKKKLRITKLFLRIIAGSLVFAVIALIFRTAYVTVRLAAPEKLLYISKMFIFMECFYFFKHSLNPLLYYFASLHESTDKEIRFFMSLDDSS